MQKYKRKIQSAKDKTTKLIPTLTNKEKHVLHIRNLELYLKLGMKLTKIYRVLQFNEFPWLADYIAFNTKKRAEAKNNFEKDYFKLMNNSVFGKTMEILRKRINVAMKMSLQSTPQKPISYLVKCLMKIHFQLIESKSNWFK